MFPRRAELITGWFGGCLKFHHRQSLEAVLTGSSGEGARSRKQRMGWDTRAALFSPGEVMSGRHSTVQPLRGHESGRWLQTASRDVNRIWK
jgi:hypothetical protein